MFKLNVDIEIARAQITIAFPRSASYSQLQPLRDALRGIGFDVNKDVAVFKIKARDTAIFKSLIALFDENSFGFDVELSPAIHKMASI